MEIIQNSVDIRIEFTAYTCPPEYGVFRKEYTAEPFLFWRTASSRMFRAKKPGERTIFDARIGEPTYES